MPELPSGTVTFLFTDIEGSTRLWQQSPTATDAALARHDRLLRHAIEAHHGHVFKTLGDGFCAAFPHAQDAVQAAVAAQRALLEEKQPFRVRMAVHTGEARAREGDYFGPALNHVARLLAAGHGGQVLVSQATDEQLRSALPADQSLRPLGAHRLRDIVSRETIFQAPSPGLPAEFPPLNTLDVAFRRGLLRATAVSAVVLVVMAGLALIALNQARRATEGQRRLRRHLYAVQMNVAQQAWQVGSVARARELLGAQRPQPGEEDLRGFEWRYLWRLCQSDARFTLRGHAAAVNSVAFSPEGKLLASGSGDKTVKLWDVATRQELTTLQGHKAGVWSIRFSPDGKLLASGSGDRTVKLWDVAARREVATLRVPLAWHDSMAFSPDGKTLATGTADGALKLWDLLTRREAVTLKRHRSGWLPWHSLPVARPWPQGATGAT